jgi:hypothetical protein
MFPCEVFGPTKLHFPQSKQTFVALRAPVAGRVPSVRWTGFYVLEPAVSFDGEE